MDSRKIWIKGGKKSVLETYEKLHKGKIGAHWLWVAIEQIAAGEPEVDVLRDYGYVPHKKITFHTPRSSVFTKEDATMTSGFDEIFKQQQEQEEARHRNMIAAQIRNAIIEIEEGDMDDAIARLKSLIGESDSEGEAKP